MNGEPSAMACQRSAHNFKAKIHRKESELGHGTAVDGKMSSPPGIKQPHMFCLEAAS